VQRERHRSGLFAPAAVDRQDVLLNGVSRAAAIWNQLGAVTGLDVRDPLQDRRLIEFAFSVPERLWHGPQRRWLARVAMKDILPEETRRGAAPGLQAADVCDRLADHPDELNDAMDQLQSSPLARRVIDVPYCRQAASYVLARDRRHALWMATHILLPGLQTGLFLSDVERGEPRLLQVPA